MAAANEVIEIEGLTKNFGGFQALRGLDLRVERGQVHGFLGPNGAGKSTTIRVLLGLLKASGGKVRMLGADPWSDVVELHRRLAYVPGDVSLWPGMTGGEAIDLLAALRGGVDERRRAELVERFELDPTKRGRQYSKGNRQKVAIVAALASDVELLILDEPTSGLDPLMEAVFQEVVGEVKARGVTVLLSSHILSEVEALADRISIIRDGRIVESGTLDQLRGHARTSIHAVVQHLPGGESEAAAALAAVPVLEDVHLDGRRLSASVDSARITEAISALTGYGFASLTVAPPSLESLFLSHYETTEGEAGGAK
ncbi:ABC transporter ATP-binding protein [Actinospica sp. MGRD01-02]|uniref:ABC transporter ATP-binding protein n=1 Tax=Actinospica acidithermotolerans TaxID=2828514 RepID=A0A941EE42_9ACTN|nr:ABC transporter ATP-binding protein [Actinospica acidithermotolerans]MBR7828787.1 ABC transporter ATP-binding protein [Actinospica acidithermotolerans]